mmetsp:Transcript_25114/g.38377  ORF Transcript_25114/g.38377 Transcript_25114/m.38377 type:complete len:137 (-) Transcript_25114:388-798(-)
MNVCTHSFIHRNQFIPARARTIPIPDQMAIPDQMVIPMAIWTTSSSAQLAKDHHKEWDFFVFLDMVQYATYPFSFVSSVQKSPMVYIDVSIFFFCADVDFDVDFDFVEPLSPCNNSEGTIRKSNETRQTSVSLCTV